MDLPCAYGDIPTAEAVDGHVDWLFRLYADDTGASDGADGRFRVIGEVCDDTFVGTIYGAEVVLTLGVKATFIHCD